MVKRGRVIPKNKGMSTIVAVLLIVMVTLVAAGITWVVVKKMLSNESEQVTLGKFTLDLSIEGVQIECDSLEVTVTVKRNKGEGGFAGLNFIFYDGVNTEIFTEKVSLDELEVRTFQFTLNTILPENIKNIKIVPILFLDSGKETFGSVEDTWENEPWNYECVAACNLIAPNALDATEISKNGFVANWESLESADGYIIDIATDIDFENLIVNSLNLTNALSYEVTDLESNTFYYYRVRAYSNCIGENSEPITASTLFSEGYGLLYNYYAASDSRKIANTGWHVPSSAEYSTLLLNWNYNLRHIILSESGTQYWNTDFGTNEAEFNARGNGIRFVGISTLFVNRNSLATLGTSSAGTYWSILTLSPTSSGIESSYYSLKTGAGMRLIKDSTTCSNGEAGTYIGNDGKAYRTICIGTQEWLADNLAETRYRNGDEIPEVTDNTTWAGLTTGARCNYVVEPVRWPYVSNPTEITENSFVANWVETSTENGFYLNAEGYYLDIINKTDQYLSPTDFFINNLDVGHVTSYEVTGLPPGGYYYYRLRAYNATYTTSNSNMTSAIILKTNGHGLLYNWYAVNDIRNISNVGWHVATWRNFSTLNTYLGGSSVSGGKLKETGNLYWMNGGGTNTAGFYGKGAGYRRDDNSVFGSLHYHTGWWNAEQANINQAYSSSLTDNSNYFSTSTGPVMLYSDKNRGYSVRLVKDVSCSVNGQTGTYTGNDGKSYLTICIGNQEWLAENLEETRYRNGDEIPEVTDNAAWMGLTTGALCAYNNDWDYV